MGRGMFVFGLIGIVLISLPLTSFAQGTGGVTTGCYVDVIRDCAGMAANATPPKPSVACKDRNCVEVLGTLRCEASVGINPPPFITIPVTYHDVRQADSTITPPEVGRTAKSSVVSPWDCGSIYECECLLSPKCDSEPGGYLEQYFPVEWSTYGPIDC